MEPVGAVVGARERRRVTLEYYAWVSTSPSRTSRWHVITEDLGLRWTASTSSAHMLIEDFEVARHHRGH